MTIVLNPSHPKAKPKCIACLNLPKLTPYFTHEDVNCSQDLTTPWQN